MDPMAVEAAWHRGRRRRVEKKTSLSGGGGNGRADDTVPRRGDGMDPIMVEAVGRHRCGPASSGGNRGGGGVDSAASRCAWENLAT
jgi:hypothetical protein